MIRHVLAAVSVTPHGEIVAREGHALARQLGARFTLLHVLPGGEPPLARAWRGPERAHREARLAADWFLDELRRDLHDPTVRSVLEEARGDVVEAVAALARDLGADLVAVGTDAQPRLTPGFGQRLIRCTPLPVVLIGPARPVHVHGPRERAARVQAALPLPARAAAPVAAGNA